MKENDRLTISAAGGTYDLRIAESLSPELLAPFASGRSCMVVADSNLSPLYLAEVYDSLKKAGASAVATMEFPAGEQSKTFSTVEMICRTAARRHLDRNSVFFALGGGIPGDMTGFAAAIYMRGIDFVQLPTSLLAMVDSSVGGKTGCDLPEGKNLIGAFHQPKGVLIAEKYLNTLPDREYLCGLAEIIKTAAILEESFFADLEQNLEKIKERDREFTRRMILRSCAWKAEIVAQDEKEGGIRAILNYGHTFGHAMEKVSDFTISHGEGVAAGMCMAAEFGCRIGKVLPETAERQKSLIRAVGLPVAFDLDKRAVFQAMLSDKKAYNGTLRFVFTPEIGHAEIVPVSPETVREYLGI